MRIMLGLVGPMGGLAAPLGWVAAGFAWFAGLFVVLALGMFGLFDLQVPSALQSRLATVSGRQKSGTVIGAFVMGALSSLIVTACVAPPLVATVSPSAQVTRKRVDLLPELRDVVQDHTGLLRERLALRSTRTGVETLLHPRGLGDFRVMVVTV